VAARLDDREVLSQLPLLNITYLPNNLFIFLYFVICFMFNDFTNIDFEIGRNINKLKNETEKQLRSKSETYKKF